MTNSNQTSTKSELLTRIKELQSVHKTEVQGIKIAAMDRAIQLNLDCKAGKISIDELEGETVVAMEAAVQAIAEADKLLREEFRKLGVSHDF
jgi:hypothetical protein